MERINYVDVLKAFAIYCVVLGHTCGKFGENIYYIKDYGLYPFHMPLFAVLSGLFFNYAIDTKTFLTKKIKQIALPHFVWCFIVAIVIRGANESYLHFTEGYDIHFKSWIECYIMWVIAWGWWFLRALFLSFLYAYFSIKICKQNVLCGVSLSIVLLYSLSLSGVIPNMKFMYFVFLYPFFSVGILLKEYKLYVLRNVKYIWGGAFVIYTICMYFWQGFDDTFYNMNTSMLEPAGNAGITGTMVPLKIFYRFMTGVSGSIILILFAKWLATKLPSIPFIINIGRNTLGIYILHTFAFDFINYRGNLFKSEFLSIVFCFIFAAIITLISNKIVNLTSRIKLFLLLLWGK